MIALIDIGAAMHDATITVALMVAALLFISGMLAGSAMTSWWHERRQPHRAWRYQIARELHGDARFEPDAPGIVNSAPVTWEASDKS